MPLYEYRCRKCGETFEVLQKFADPPLISCRCGCGGTVEKLISRSSFQLKGTGWYVTDYKGKGEGKSGKSKKKKESKDSSSSSTSSSASSTDSSSDKD